jgi:hypothetical protein
VQVIANQEPKKSKPVRSGGGIVSNNFLNTPRAFHGDIGARKYAAHALGTKQIFWTDIASSSNSVAGFGTVSRVPACRPANAASVGWYRVCTLSQGTRPADGTITIGGSPVLTFSPRSPKIRLWAGVGQPSPLLNNPSECTSTNWLPGNTVRNPIQSEEFKIVTWIAA